MPKLKTPRTGLQNFWHPTASKKGTGWQFFCPIPPLPAIFFGILKAGAVCVTCNPLYTASELKYQLRDSGLGQFSAWTTPSFYPTTASAIQGTDVQLTVICNIKTYLPKWKAILGSLLGKIPKADQHAPGHLFFDQIIECYPPEPPDIVISPQKDLALIIYTGGTTGVPKGAALTHSNFAYNLRALEEWTRLPHSPGEETRNNPARRFSYLLRGSALVSQLRNDYLYDDRLRLGQPSGLHSRPRGPAIHRLRTC